MDLFSARGKLYKLPSVSLSALKLVQFDCYRSYESSISIFSWWIFMFDQTKVLPSSHFRSVDLNMMDLVRAVRI